jgi:HlyD family secretion protein
VPLGALARRGDDWIVYVIDSGRARTRAIELGPRNATHAVVLRGLAADERVIVYPPDAVHEGVRVTAR